MSISTAAGCSVHRFIVRTGCPHLPHKYNHTVVDTWKEFILDNLQYQHTNPSAHTNSLFHTSAASHAVDQSFHNWARCNCTLEKSLMYLLSYLLFILGRKILVDTVFWPHLDHVELGNAVFLHTHGHGDAIFLDQHGESRWWGKGGSGRRLTRERGREGADGQEGERGQERLGDGGLLYVTCQITSWSPHWWFLLGEGQNKSIRDTCCEKIWE